MTRPGLMRALIGVGIFFVGILIVFGLFRLIPQRSPLPAQLARQDEKAAGGAAQAIGADVQGQAHGASINIDLTRKEIRDAFDALPAPQPPAGAADAPRPLPAAPVDRVRERLNEGVARANRATGASRAAE